MWTLRYSALKRIKIPLPLRLWFKPFSSQKFPAFLHFQFFLWTYLFSYFSPWNVNTPLSVVVALWRDQKPSLFVYGWNFCSLWCTCIIPGLPSRTQSQEDCSARSWYHVKMRLPVHVLQNLTKSSADLMTSSVMLLMFLQQHFLEHSVAHSYHTVYCIL